MSCPWVENWCQKEAEGYKAEQFIIIMDILGGYSAHLEENMQRLVGKKSDQVLRNMPKLVISSTYNISVVCCCKNNSM